MAAVTVAILVTFLTGICSLAFACTVLIDRVMANAIGSQTRFASLTIVQMVVLVSQRDQAL